MGAPIILVTGFEPFGGEKVNASWEAAQRLDGWRCGDAVAVARQLPCVYDACVAEFVEAFERLSPEIVLMTGQAARRGVISVERVARNVDGGSAPDNRGVLRADEANGPARLEATAPVSDIARVAPDHVRLVRRYVEDMEQNLARGKGLWIEGDVGTGKTTLAMLVSKAALDTGRSVAIYSLPRLLSLLRESMDTDRGLLDFLDRLSAVDLLHIDDLGAENRTDWVLEQLYTIVNARYEAQRTIVATTNLMPDELAERIGARTVSRLVEICGDPIPLYGKDRRREFRPEEMELLRPGA